MHTVNIYQVNESRIKESPVNFMLALQACIKENKIIKCKFEGNQEFFQKDSCLLKNVSNFLHLIYYGEWYICE